MFYLKPLGDNFKFQLSSRNIDIFKLNNNSSFSVLDLLKYDQIFMHVSFFNLFFSKKKSKIYEI
ncbi:hypothetical protein E5P55_00900 [Candidatus Pinguicoccus supinus]|uniref:Uncharacterized protein n=1 Tax=Candidatus Pinguicoccus supinus TaxID=2529394 RepID=A0A7T0BSJ7_9BACT|nr:hypothetical protein E5P55_00900 [Candidatus Pinguicoccus supinus]